MWKRRVVWGLAVAGALALYIFENNSGTRMLFLTVLLLPALSGGALAAFRPQLSAALELPPAMARGEAEPCTLILTNLGVLPVVLADCELEVRNRLTGEQGTLSLSVGLTGRETARTPVKLQIDHCGAVDVTLAQVRVRDPFGLFTRKTPCTARGRTVVPPAVRRLVLSPVAEDVLSEDSRYDTQQPGNDPSETFQIREYAPGDPVRRIHWKLTEKLDKPLVRDFGMPLEARLAMELAPAPVTWAQTDRALDSLFSAGEALCAQELPCTVRWPSEGGQEERSLFLSVEWEEFKNNLLSNPLPPVSLTAEGFEIP